jgi:hypothetical protein
MEQIELPAGDAPVVRAGPPRVLAEAPRAISAMSGGTSRATASVHRAVDAVAIDIGVVAPISRAIAVMDRIMMRRVAR